MAQKRKTLRQKRKTTRRRQTSRSRKTHGGCKDGNCLFQTQTQPLPPTLPHSNLSQNGGQFPPSFSNVPVRSFYPLNNYVNDPTQRSIPSRLIPSVGGRRKIKHGTRKSQRGGFEPSQASQALSTLLSYGASSTPSNVTNLSFYDKENRPYA